MLYGLTEQPIDRFQLFASGTAHTIAIEVLREEQKQEKLDDGRIRGRAAPAAEDR